MAGEALEILQQALIDCEQAGVVASITPLYSDGHECVGIVLASARLVDGKISV